MLKNCHTSKTTLTLPGISLDDMFSYLLMVTSAVNTLPLRKENFNLNTLREIQ